MKSKNDKIKPIKKKLEKGEGKSEFSNMKNKPAKEKTIRQKKYKTYRKQLKSETFELGNELLLNKFDDAVIECKVGNIENIFSPYDIVKNSSINDSFHSYLMQEVEIVPPKHDIELRMFVDEGTTKEQEAQIRRAIKTHYRFMVTSANITSRKNAIASSMLYAGGIATLLLNFLTSGFITSLPIKETLLISTWFLFWEATSMLFFDRSNLNSNRYNVLRIYNAKIEFVRRNLIKTPFMIDKDNEMNNPFNEEWQFAGNEKESDELFELVLVGKKTATSYLYDAQDWAHDNNPISIITNYNKSKKIVIRTTKKTVCKFSEVSAEHAFKEGEGDLSLEYWREVHKDFFLKELQLKEKPFDENIKIVCEEFEVISK